MTEFTRYQRSQIAELRPYEPGDSMEGVSISQPDRDNGSPKVGDMIARNPENHADQWLIAAAYFASNFEPAPRQAKWPGRVTSSKTECAHATCPDHAACRKGCIHQQPITWDDAPTAH